MAEFLTTWAVLVLASAAVQGAVKFVISKGKWQFTVPSLPWGRTGEVGMEFEGFAPLVASVRRLPAGVQQGYFSLNFALPRGD